MLVAKSVTSPKSVLMVMVIVVMEVENINGVKEHPCPELAGSLSQNHPVAAVACARVLPCNVCGCVACAGQYYAMCVAVQGVLL